MGDEMRTVFNNLHSRHLFEIALVVVGMLTFLAFRRIDQESRNIEHEQKARVEATCDALKKAREDVNKLLFLLLDQFPADPGIEHLRQLIADRPPLVC